MGGRGRRRQSCARSRGCARRGRSSTAASAGLFESQLRFGATLPPSLSAKAEAMGLPPAAAGLTPGMINRYSRHLLLPEFGIEASYIWCSSRLEGQLTVYHHNGSPCYRCLFPNPPAAAACQVPGVIGCLQALEAIKVATAVGELLCGRILLFDALSACIRIVKIHGSSSTCTICGENPVFTQQDFVNFD